MAYSFEILETAKRNILEIITYLNESSKSTTAATAFMQEFQNKMCIIESQPELYGLSRFPNLASLGYRSAYMQSYVILYFVRDEKIIVAHVFHQREDYANLI